MTAQEPTVTVRAAEPDDAAALSALIGSEGVFEGTSQLPMMPVASRIERFSKPSPEGLLLVACTPIEEKSTNIGMIGLHLVQPGLRRAHVRGLGISVARDWQGRGIGDQLMRSALHWADRWAGILRIELTVLCDNARALALYERHGFLCEGIMHAHILRDGVYSDTQMMARLHPQPPQIPRLKD
ncbi:MAG: GNAT family N-acetyltransferase [Brachymonas sp.]